jgi:hypothetical protein
MLESRLNPGAGLKNRAAPRPYMPITYTIDHHKQLIYETWTGEIQAADLAAYWQGYLSNPEVMAIRRTIVDLRAATIGFSGLDFESLIREIILPILQGRKWISAIVAESPVQYGVSRQYQVFAERFSKDAIFNAIADAESWVMAQGNPDAKA